MSENVRQQRGRRRASSDDAPAVIIPVKRAPLTTMQPEGSNIRQSYELLKSECHNLTSAIRNLLDSFNGSSLTDPPKLPTPIPRMHVFRKPEKEIILQHRDDLGVYKSCMESLQTMVPADLQEEFRTLSLYTHRVIVKFNSVLLHVSQSTVEADNSPAAISDDVNDNDTYSILQMFYDYQVPCFRNVEFYAQRHARK